MTGAEIGHAPPHPSSGLVDHLHPVRRRALDAVASSRDHVDDPLEPVDVELRRLADPLVGGHAHTKVLPLRTVWITQGPKAHEAALSGDQ